MRLLIIGTDEKAAIEQVYIKYLKEYPIVIDFFPAQNLFSKYYNKNLFNKIIFRLGFSRIYLKINRLLKKKVESFSPDIIWVFKGMEVFPDTLKWASDKKIKLINYNPDNPFIFSGHGSGNKNITKSIHLYNRHITYDQKVSIRLSNEFHIPTDILPFGFEISPELFSDIKNIDEIVKVCFIGNPDNERSSFINDLAKRGIELDVYGHNWNKINLHHNINFFPPLYGEAFYKVLRKYRVQLNMMRKHNLHSHNMRSFEIPAIGGVMLAPSTEDHHAFFEDEKDFFSYNDVDECIVKINYILRLNADKIEKIRDAARSKSINSSYSYKNRAEQALKILTQLYES